MAAALVAGARPDTALQTSDGARILVLESVGQPPFTCPSQSSPGGTVRVHYVGSAASEDTWPNTCATDRVPVPETHGFNAARPRPALTIDFASVLGSVHDPQRFESVRRSVLTHRIFASRLPFRPMVLSSSVHCK
jgi:hypothetical protein